MTLGRQLLVAASGVLLSTLVVYGVLSVLPKTYSSSQSLYFPLAQAAPASGALAALAGGGQGVGSDAVGGFNDQLSPLIGSSPATATGILKSRSCLKFVVESLNLDGLWKASMDEAIETLRGDVSVSSDDNGLLVISAQAGSPELCVQIIESMYAFLEKRSDELTLNVGKKNREYFASRVEELTKQSKESEENYIQALKDSGGVTAPEVVKAYADLASKIAESKSEEASASAQLDKLKSQYASRLNGDSNGALSAVDSPQSTLGQAATALATKLQDRRLKLVDVGKQFTKSSPEYQTALKEVQTAEAEAANIVKGAKTRLGANTLPGIAEADNQLIGLRALNRELDKVLVKYQGMLSRAPAAGAEITRAQAKFQADLTTLQGLQMQLEKARLQEQNDPARFEIVDPAEPISRAVAPRKAFLSGVWALFATMCFGWWIVRGRVRFVD